MHITNDGEVNGVKTKSSVRRVPIHPLVKQLRFLEYVQRMAKLGNGRLFPELRADRLGALTGNWSKWFGRYLREEIGITNKRKVFHSFRHSFKDAAREVGIEEAVHDAITGHRTAATEGRNYGGKLYPLKPLHHAIQKVQYRDVNYSLLKRMM